MLKFLINLLTMSLINVYFKYTTTILEFAELFVVQRLSSPLSSLLLYNFSQPLTEFVEQPLRFEAGLDSVLENKPSRINKIKHLEV